MNAHAIYSALGGKICGGDAYRVHCPAHEDRKPSLSVTDKDGITLVYCFAGCSQEAVIHALREKGLWQPENKEALERRKSTESRLHAKLVSGIAASDRANGRDVTWTDADERAVEDASEILTPLAELLDRVEAFLGRFVVYPSEVAKVAHVLWILHTHCMDEWESTPRIAFLSPEPGSGKTRALEVSETMVPRPVEAVSATPAYLFRKVSDPSGPPTILYDEIDTVFGPRAKDNEEIRGMLNAGHRRGAMAGRCVAHGNVITTEELPAYCAVAMAGLGNLPDTILTRSVVIRMRRRAPTERAEPYRRRIHAREGNELRDRLAVWAEQFSLDGNYPEMPDGVEDRAADVWEPLIAIADAAGERWSKRARVAAVSLVSLSRETTPSLGVRLLADLRQIFSKSTQLSTESILQRLRDMEEAPWSDLRGKPLDARRLAHYLRPYGVKSKTIREDSSTCKGYTVEDLSDNWGRYLAPSDKCVTTVTSETRELDVTDVTAVTDIKVDREGVDERISHGAASRA